MPRVGSSITCQGSNGADYNKTCPLPEEEGEREEEEEEEEKNAAKSVHLIHSFQKEKSRIVFI